MFFIVAEANETILDFSQGNVKVLWICSTILFCFNIISIMTQYNTLNVNLSNSQLSKLKLGIKNSTERTLKTSSNVVGDSNDENNFPHKFVLTNTQVSKLHKALVNNSSADIKISRVQLHKIGQSGGSLGWLLEPLLKTGLP